MRKIYWWTQPTIKTTDFEQQYELILKYWASKEFFKFFYKEESSWYYVKRIDKVAINEDKCEIYGEIEFFDKNKYSNGLRVGWRIFTWVSFSKESITKVKKL